MVENIQENPSERESLLALAEAAQRTGKTRKTKSRISEESTESGGDLAAAAQRLFDPILWKPLCRAPFKLAKAITGESYVDVTEEENVALATATSTWAEYNLSVDPARISLIIMLSTWLAIIGEKAGIYYTKKAEEQREKAKYGQSEKLKVM